MRMLKLLQHFKLIVNHLLVTLDVTLQDDLDSDFARGTIRLTDHSICACAKCSTESIF